MNEENIKNIVEKIDMETTNYNARVRFIQYGGGSDEMMIEATKNGFVRLGLLMLKAAYANDKEEQKKISSDMAEMITPDSDCCFDWIERKEQIKEDKFPPESRITEYFALSIFVMLVAVIVLGLANGIRVIFSLIT